jgi:hypothetical protein
MPAFGADARKARLHEPGWAFSFWSSRPWSAPTSLLDEGDMAGAETWHRILKAIERLQARHPAEGEKVH